MAEEIEIRINGRPVPVSRGATVAAALASIGITRFRQSVCGDERSALCGMGICFECRVTLNGQSHCRSCMTLCEPGMEVRTDE
jgi:D-hydroxyproline dehydrogenase subunit gamma